MIIFCMGLLVLCMLARFYEIRMEYSYSFFDEIYQGTDEKEIFSGISFFRTNESYSTPENAKRMLGGDYEYGGEEQLKNAIKQKELNKSKRARRIRRTQTMQEMKKSIQRVFGSFCVKDYMIFLWYLGFPIVCVLLLQFTPAYNCFEKVIAGVSNHRVDIYLSQLSLTFITISLMSIFSDSSAIILWENIVKKTLIEPPASCFKAYFSYSFLYLLFSTLSIVFRYDIGIGVLFVFNIFCLFDLSRTMINCYYDPYRKKKKVIKDFIHKIEEANIESLQRSSEKTSKEYLSEVKSIFEDFNYYIGEAFDKGKYSDVGEFLGVYGKLLAHVDSAAIAAEEIAVLDWYNSKTYKAYKEMVQNYYAECNAIVLGLSNTNAQPMSISGLGIRRNIIDNALVRLANDIPNVHEVDDIYSLALYAFYMDILFIARNIDIDNLEHYLIEVENSRKDIILKYKANEIKKVSCILVRNLYKKMKSKRNDINVSVLKNRFDFSMSRLIGNVILLYTEDILLLEMDFLCWSDIKKEDRKEIIDSVNRYIDECIESFSDERKKQCLSRKEEALQNMEEKLRSC